MSQPKYVFANLKSDLEERGITFADFMKEVDKNKRNPSIRSWNNATGSVGVAKTTINNMQRLIISAYSSMEEELLDEVKTYSAVE